MAAGGEAIYLSSIICYRMAGLKIAIIFTSHLKKRILVQDRGGFGFQTAGIRLYDEDLKTGSNTEIGPKDFFEMACS